MAHLRHAQVLLLLVPLCVKFERDAVRFLLPLVICESLRHLFWPSAAGIRWHIRSTQAKHRVLGCACILRAQAPHKRRQDLQSEDDSPARLTAIMTYQRP